MLIIFAGLPGVGKSTIAREASRQLEAVYLRADTIEQAMRDYGLSNDQIGGMGYTVGYALATENLRLGRTVVADTVNPWQLTRDAWRDAARRAERPFLDVEIVCSDVEEHRRRVESRVSDIPDHKLPTWEQVMTREIHPWDAETLRIDTASTSVDEAVTMIKKRAAEIGGPISH